MLFELRVFLTSALYELTEADKLLALIFGHEMRASQAPSLLEASYKVHKLRVVPQLWVHDFHVFSVPFHEQVLHVIETTLYVCAQLAYGHALTSADLATDFIGDD